MPFGKRAWLNLSGLLITSAGLALGGAPICAADNLAAASAATDSVGTQRLSERELGNLIRAMGMEVKLDDRRYDFTFTAPYNKEPWNLSMSAVLSENGSAIWVMAWLDQCPKSAADCPRMALLRLLAKNDTLGNGKFFAFIPSNSRFVLQRVIPNENLTTAKFHEILQDLGASVVETYPYWSVSNWKAGSESMPDSRSKSSAQPATETGRANARQSAAQRASYRSDN